MARKRKNEEVVPRDEAQPGYSNLEPSYTITYGTPSIEIRGVLRAKATVPTGNVTVKIEGTRVFTHSEIDRDGSFCVHLDTSRILARNLPYTISMRYPATDQWKEARHSETTLTVKKASPYFTGLLAIPPSVTYGRDYVTVSGVLGASCSRDGDPEVFPAGHYVTVKVPNTSIKDQNCLVDSNGEFSADLYTQGVPVGSYVVLCTYPGDENFNPAKDGPLDFGVVQASPVFVRLDSPSILYGQGPTGISGKIKSSSGTEIPGGSVKIGLGTETASAPVDPACGDFSASFDTQFLPAGSTPIRYDYPGDGNFTGLHSGQGRLLITPAMPRLWNLSSVSIDHGTPKTTLSGSIGSSSGRIPSGSVEITLAGATDHATIDPLAGGFQATFNTRTLPVSGSPFAVTYHYPGDNNFTSATDNSTTVSFNTVQVTGRVLLAGNGVPNVYVRAFDSVHGGQVYEDKTISDGSFALTVPAGLAVHVDFPSTHTFPDGRKVHLIGANRSAVQPFSPLVVDAAYELRDALIRGTTVRKIPGSRKTEPLAGVKVYLEDPKTRAIVAHTVTDAQGGFGFSKAGQHIVRFEAQIRHGLDLLTTPTPTQGVLAQSDYPSPPMTEVMYSPAFSKVVGQVTDGMNGLEGITVELETPPDLSSTRQTDSLGFYSFQISAAAGCRLNFKAVDQDSQGTKWELQPDQQSSQEFSVDPGETKTAATTKYRLERHTISWTVTSQGVPVAHKLVEVRTADGLSVLQAKRTNDKGNAFFDVGQANNYAVWVYPDDRVAGGVMTQVVTVNSQNDGLTEIPAPGDGGFGHPHGDVKESVIDLQSYPVLTEEIPSGMTSTQSGSGGSWNSPSAPIGQVAQNAINEVLSWRSKSNDSKAFVSALNQAFDLKEVEGHTRWSWTPRSYTVQTDMGAVTGAQASIYNRATVALTQSLPLLDGLYPLLPTIPPEDLTSIREVARSQYTSLVNEFGVVGGPRPPRVDQLFTLLLGDSTVTNPENLLSGTLHEVRDRFGLRRQFVTTIAHEQNLTNFLILADYVIGLGQSWNNERAFFVRNGGGPEPYFGTQLVLLSRGLDVVSQSVRDAYFAMDSVFLGASERQTAQLNFSGITLPRALEFETVPYQFPVGTSALFVSELLEWVDRAASEELPQVLQTSGKDGLPALKSVIDNLRHFVRASILPTQKAHGLPPGYRTPRVQRTMLELADALDETYKLAFDIKAPRLPVFGNRHDKQST